MENASKALLIAAAVLVTIIIITVGMKIYTSSSGTQKVAMDTGKTLKDKTGEATDLAVGEITNKTKIKYYDSSGNAINKDKLNRGDKIIIGTETFGVLSAVTGKIIAISYYNITLTDSPVQSVSAGTIAFSSEKYWGETTGNIKMDEKDDNGSYKNNIQGYIDKY